MRVDQGSSQTPKYFDAITVRIASSEQIKEWAKKTACHCPPGRSKDCACGEVKKPETINYRTFRPEQDGLFCEAIFGPQKDWECACGKYKRIKHKGVVCDRCGVEVTRKEVRRERMGYIQLAAPVSHIWFFKGLPSRIGLLLDISHRDLEKVLYFESYIVMDPMESPLQKKQLLTETEYARFRKEEHEFRAEMGAAAIKELLMEIDLETEIATLRRDLAETKSKQKEKKFAKRLTLLSAIQKSGNKPEWTILEVIPVIPPELRPLVPLDGGRFATSDLNDLYRRVINRNNRLKRLMELRAPEVIIRNEKRMLQEAVDALLDNGRHGRVVRGPGNRPLKSLSDMLKGKPGRFRQNLLGKRVDYSGRSVIVVGPELTIDQCGLPRKMALELFKPFIIRRLQEKGYATTIKSAKKMAERASSEVWEVLEEVISEHPVILNRAPTLHRLGIQAFQPILVEGKAIRIHPLVCQAFNADFDGDQMAVHVPLSTEAQVEAKLLMMASRNILKPAHGHPIAVPDLDIVLGCNYLTKARDEEADNGRLFANADDVAIALSANVVDIHTAIRYRTNGNVTNTTPGRVVFNQILPEGLASSDEDADGDLDFCNRELEADDLGDLVAKCYDVHGNRRTAQFLDELKNLGFEYATKAGISICINDMIIPGNKQDLISNAQGEVKEVTDRYQEGGMTDGERYNRVVNIWGRLKSDLETSLFATLQEDTTEYGMAGFNSVHIMTDSGARSKKDAISQIAGMRGLMGKPSGEIIETPIFANLREGLTVLEYFISTHGARKGLADTAIKTASSGYLTRKLVDIAQDVIVTEEDCGTLNGIYKTSLGTEDEPGILAGKIGGRVAAEDVLDPSTGEPIVLANGEITKFLAKKIEDAGIFRLRIRSALTCESERGVCRKCYGFDLASWKLVHIGEAVGIIAAQSIGEPGTQLTMRTFHTGGAVSGVGEQSHVEAKSTGLVKYHNVSTVSRQDGTLVVTNRNGAITVIDDSEVERERHSAIYGATLTVADNGEIQKGALLMEWDPHNVPILTEVSGRAKFEDIFEGITMREEIDESTSLSARVIIEHREENLHARIAILDDNDEVITRYDMSTGAHITTQDGDRVLSGDVLAKIPSEISKAKDIVLGLPRVTELFEARKPKDCATISDIDGNVKFAGISRGMRVLKVTNPNKTENEYRIPRGKHLIVREGDWVAAGDRLTDGPINPHDILSVLGENRVQEYLVDEVQEVYRTAGEHINDKHVEVIVSQMLRKIRVIESGDTEYLVGYEVPRTTFRGENQRLIDAGGEPATGEPILQGITKAALSTESFISAASFQQTTNVLTTAAISGKRDELRGLKENVIMGHLIPAGSGVPQYRQIGAYAKDSQPALPGPEEEAAELVDEA